MGVIGSAKRAAREEGPSCPSLFMSTFEKYRELKFLRHVTEDSVKLYARDTLNWQDLAYYSQMSGQTISILEAELIMGLDAIFEGRNDG
jgi:hypothetical protein